MNQACHAQRGRTGGFKNKDGRLCHPLSCQVHAVLWCYPKWRSLRKHGQLRALQPQPRGPKVIHTPEQDEIARLTRQVAHLEAKLTQAEAIIDIQKKVSALLGLPPAEQ